MKKIAIPEKEKLEHSFLCLYTEHDRYYQCGIFTYAYKYSAGKLHELARRR